MTKGSDDAGAGAAAQGSAPPATGAPAAGDEAESSGLDNALARLRKEFGDDVVTLFRTSGPRTGHTKELALVLVEVGDYPRRVFVQAFTTGNYKLFAELGGKSDDQQIASLKEMFEPASR